MLLLLISQATTAIWKALNNNKKKKEKRKEKKKSALAGVAQLGGMSSCELKGHGFDSQSGHMPKLQVRYPLGACATGN